MKALVVVPIADVRPGEPRWYCEDGEVPGVPPSLMPGELHAEPADECGCEDCKYAAVIREVTIVDNEGATP